MNIDQNLHDNAFSMPDDIFAKQPSLDEALKKADEASASKQVPTKETTEEDSTKYSPYTKELLLALYDDMVFSNSYKESVKVRGFQFGLKTRSSEDLVAINRVLDNFKAQSANSYQTYANYLTLAASLNFVDNTELKDGDLEQAYKHLITLPTFKVDIMLIELSKFDRKVSMAIEVGRENF